MTLYTKIPMKGDRIQWNPDLFKTIETMRMMGIPWEDIATKLHFPYRSTILKERFYAYIRHEKERQNAKIAKQFGEIQKTEPLTFGKLLRLCFFRNKP